MDAHPSLALVAELIGERARAAMLAELLDGRALTASELAARAEVAPSTASEHLGKLVGGGLLAREAQGRHRYYRLAGPAVAELLEALSVIGAAADGGGSGFAGDLLGDLRFARSCYDHLAGGLGVALADALVARRLLVEEGDYRLTGAGEVWFSDFGVDVAAARRARRSFARRCLDWSERRPHLAGALGAGLLERLLAVGWVERQPGERMLLLTATGRRRLGDELGLRAPSR